MNNKKSQAAMEFLMTYGWAILIILIVMAALFFLGIFSPSKLNACNVDQPFGCVDVKVSAVTGLDSVVVNAGQVSGTPTFTYTAGGTCTVATWSATFTPNTRNTITLTCPNGNVGDSFSGSFVITYTSAVSGVSHTSTLTYSGKME